jgi:Transposase
MVPSDQIEQRDEHTEPALPYQWFVGIDWGSQTHQVCVLDQDRHCVGARRVAHEGVALAECAAGLTTLAAGEGHRVAVAIEVPRGAIVELLVERGFQVLAIHPQQRDRLRDRHTVAGAKDDRRDAFVFADSLRTDRPSCRQGQVEEPHLLMLRELSRTEEALLTECRRATPLLRTAPPTVSCRR